MSAKIFLEKMSFNGNFICFDSLNLEFSILRMNIIKVFFVLTLPTFNFHNYYTIK